MKKLVTTFALTTLLASPAFAAQKNGQSVSNEAQAAYASANWSYIAPSSTDVVVSGKIVGRDPDPAIRLALMREGDQTAQGGN